MNIPALWAAALFLVLSITPAVTPGMAETGADSAVAASSADRPPESLEALMSLFAASGGVRARFHETRHLALLVHPIETDGRLYFRPPDELAKHQTHPGTARFVVKGSVVSIRDETGLRVIDLDSSEVAKTLVGNLAALLRGDLPLLRERYTVEFRSHPEVSADAENGPPEGWQLDLVPRSKAVRAVVERLRVQGRGGRLEFMETLESNGDRAVAVLSDVETGVDFERAELADVFSLDASSNAPDTGQP